jgi:nucleotide-binding universal stress UspA family protein
MQHREFQQGIPAMKSVLVPIGGSDSDEVVFETALAAARPFGAHLQFLHVRLGVGAVAQNTPHMDFAGGAALRAGLEQLEKERDARAAGAVQHVQALCARSKVELCGTARLAGGVTASCHEEEGDAVGRILFHARHSDLTVAARPRKSNGLPSDFLELLVQQSGRPILIAAPTVPRTLTGTILVCWKESADAARAVTAASPFLARAERVIFASVAEPNQAAAAAVNVVAAWFARRNIRAEGQVIKANGRTVQELLASAAREQAADLIVMGAYGHSRLRETLFGGCTKSFLRQADRPVLLMH